MEGPLCSETNVLRGVSIACFSRYPIPVGCYVCRRLGRPFFLAHSLPVPADWDPPSTRSHLPVSSSPAFSCLPSRVPQFPTPQTFPPSPCPSDGDGSARATTAMDDAASEISDWEVLSAASGCGSGADDDSEVVVVSGGGGDVLHDHFALAPAGPDAGSPGEGAWPETGDAWHGLEFPGGFDPVPRASFDLSAGVWSDEQLPPTGGADETRQGSILQATVARGASWGADGSEAEAVDGEVDQERNAVIDQGELGSALQPVHRGVGQTLDSDEAASAGESSPVQLGDGEIDAGVESSCLQDAVASDGMRAEQEEQEQGGNANAASGCHEPDSEADNETKDAVASDRVRAEQQEQEQGGNAKTASGCHEPGSEAKDGALPLAHAPVPEEGDKQVVVWWRLPFRLLHYCAWKVKPVWSFSIAAALLGLVVLGRRVYRMKHKARGLPQIKIAFDDKRTSQFADRAARLNEAFLVARRVPLLRTSSGAALPWSMVQER